MSDFDVSPERMREIKKTETLARKINLLLDVVMTDEGKPFDYAAIRDGAQEKAGYYISRTR